jgi:hypothetical protein
MKLRKLTVNLLYSWASMCCHVADALSPSSDDIWRDRRWRHYSMDRAKAYDGPPMAEIDCAAWGITDACRN